MARAKQGTNHRTSMVQGPPGGSPGSPKPVQVVIKSAAGLYTNYDPADIPIGAAQIQVNIKGESVGYIQARGGFVNVLFRN